MSPLISLLVPLAVDLLKAYFKTTDSSKDDQVLNVVQQGCTYLSMKDNNTLTVTDSNYVNLSEMEYK